MRFAGLFCGCICCLWGSLQAWTLQLHTQIPPSDCVPLIDGEAYQRKPSQLRFVREHPHEFLYQLTTETSAQQSHDCEAYLGIVYELLGVAYYQTGDYQQSSFHLSLADSLALTTEDLSAQIIPKLYMGYAHFRQGEEERAREVYDQTLQLALQINDSSFLGHIYAALSFTNWFFGEEGQGLIYLNQAIDIFEKQGDDAELYRAKQNLGVYYVQKRQFKQAYEVFESVTDYYWETGQFTYGIVSAANKALALIRLERPKEAQKFLFSILHQVEPIHEPAGKSFFYAVIAQSLQKLGQWQESLTFIEQAKENLGNIPNPELIAFRQYLQASYLSSQGQYRKAIQTFEEAAVGTYAGHSFVGQEDIYFQLYQNHLKLKEYEQADAYVNRVFKIKDSLNQVSQHYTLDLTQAQRDVWTMDKDLQLLKRQREIDRLTKQQLWFTLGGILLFFAIGFFYFRNRFQGYKRRQLVREKAKLEMYNRELEELTYTLSHNLREPIRHIGAFTSLLEQRIDPQVVKEHQEYFDYLSSAAQRIHILLSDLSRFMEITQHLDPPTDIVMSDMLGKVKSTLQTQLDEAYGKFIFPHNLPSIHAHPTLIFTLFFELAENAVKFHGDRSPCIHISYEKTANYHYFMIKDKGIGINPRYRHKVFRLFYRINPSQYLDDTGIGLAIVAKIVRFYKGSIAIDSIPQESTTIHLRLPLGR